jgi:hypothetical protein
VRLPNDGIFVRRSYTHTAAVFPFSQYGSVKG